MGCAAEQTAKFDAAAWCMSICIVLTMLPDHSRIWLAKRIGLGRHLRRRVAEGRSSEPQKEGARQQGKEAVAGSAAPDNALAFVP